MHPEGLYYDDINLISAAHLGVCNIDLISSGVSVSTQSLLGSVEKVGLKEWRLHIDADF